MFNAAQRKAITRRQLNIQIENNAYAQTSAGVAINQAKLLEVDDANRVIYDLYDQQAKAYEDEARAIDGQVADFYTNTQLVEAAQVNTYPPFYPSAENYIRFIPNITEYANNVKLKGRFHPTSNDSRYEKIIMNYPNTVLSNGAANVADVIYLLDNGLSGSIPDNVYHNANAIPAGTISGFNLIVERLDLNNFSQPFAVGDTILIYDPAGSGLYRVTAANPFDSGVTVTIQIASIIPTQNGIPSGAGSRITNQTTAFSASDRENMTHSLYEEYLDNLGATLVTLANEWKAKVTTQYNILDTLQNDNRATQTIQNVFAKSNANALISYLNSWLGLSDTGVNGKFTVTNINAMSAQLIARNTFVGSASPLSGRIQEIQTALGVDSAQCITQSGNTFSTAVPDNTYYNRYFWINARINKLSGSLRRYYDASKNIGQLNDLVNNNLAMANEYDQYFVTKRLMASDSTGIAQLDNYANFSPGDIVYLVSETQPELQLGVVELMGTNQVRFDKPIPNTYIKDDISRIFKIL